MTDRDTLAVHVIALRILSDVVKDRTAATKAELAAQMKPGERTIAQLPDGTEIGGISYTRGRGGARVKDEQAFKEWVEENYPSELVTSVRTSFRDMVLANAKSDGDAIDRSSGEVIPGVEMYASEPYLSAKPTPGAGDAILAAVRLDQVLAIGAPEWDSYDPETQR